MISNIKRKVFKFHTDFLGFYGWNSLYNSMNTFQKWFVFFTNSNKSRLNSNSNFGASTWIKLGYFSIQLYIFGGQEFSMTFSTTYQSGCVMFCNRPWLKNCSKISWVVVRNNVFTQINKVFSLHIWWIDRFGAAGHQLCYSTSDSNVPRY